MKLFPKGVWGYGLLLIILFSLAALATRSVVDLANERFVLPGYERSVQEISLAIWLLTMGFMFLAGALGLWAISTTAEYESRYRIAKMVSAMNNLSDGLLAVDYQGHVRGANLAVRRLASRHFLPGQRILLSALFPALAADELKRLLNKKVPCEIEIESFLSSSVDRQDSGMMVLRLRSQPGEGLNLIFVSDITEKHSAVVHQHQIAKLQLLGRIAGGVAHDFSNILSAISGHAALIQRFSCDQRSLFDSLNVIVNETQRGIRLSRQLLALSRSSDISGRPSSNLAENAGEAVDLLRIALAAGWKIESDVMGSFPTIPLSPPQIVQIILNLSLLAADALKKPGKLSIHLRQPGSGSIIKPQDLSSRRHDLSGPKHDISPFAALIMISASADTEDSAPITSLSEQPATTTGIIDTTGIIPSVVRTLLEEAGGRLDELYVGSNKIVYRVCLPHHSLVFQPDFAAVPAMPEVMPDLKQWKILLATDEHKFRWLEKMLVGLGGIVTRKTTLETVLGAIDSDSRPDVIIADKSLFGAEANSLFKAIRKICPRTGIIIVNRRSEEEELRQTEGYIFIETNADEETWLNAMVGSRKSLAI